MKLSSNVKTFLFAVLVIMVIGSPIYFAMKTGGGAMSTSDVEGIVSRYLKENPEVVVDALNAYQMKMEEQSRKSYESQIKENKDHIVADKSSPVAGNPNGDVVLVEFFDYSCGYCRKVLPDIVKLVDSDKNVKLVLKELPILGPKSDDAARIALSIHMIAPDKYFDFHKKVMQEKSLDRDTLLQIAEGLGVNKDKILEKISSKEVSDTIAKNTELAKNIGIRGTPAFVINDELIPGAVDYETMEGLVKKARAK